MFSKMARSMLPVHPRCKQQELVDRIHLYFAKIDADPVIFRWTHRMEGWKTPNG